MGSKFYSIPTLFLKYNLQFLYWRAISIEVNNGYTCDIHIMKMNRIIFKINVIFLYIDNLKLETNLSIIM